jgi:hypothetical protein
MAHSCGVRYQEHTAVNASPSMAVSKPARTFQDLLAWQKSHQFVLDVYAFTATFPKQETYGLSLQMPGQPYPFPPISPRDFGGAARRIRHGS